MKRILALLLAALLAFTAFGCDETGRNESGSESKTEYSAPTVQNSEVYVHKNGGTDMTYAIPRIIYTKPGTDLVNRAIRDDLYPQYLTKVKVYADRDEFPVYGSMSYKWGTKGNYLSIAETMDIYASGGSRLCVYNVDLGSMTLLEDPYQMLSAFGLTKEQFIAHAKEVMAQKQYESYVSVLTGDDYFWAREAERSFRAALSDENVAKAEPVIIGDELMIRCTLGSLAGASTVEVLLPYSTVLSGDARAYIESPDYEFGVDYSSYVEDGAVYNVSLSENYKMRFVIPKICSPKGKQDKMNDKLTAETLKLLDSSINAIDVGHYSSWEYTWGFNEYILSVVMWGRVTDTSFSEYFVFNFDVFTGELVDDATLLSLYGIYSERDFSARVKGVSGTYCLNQFGTEFPDVFEFTIADETVGCAMPFVGEMAELWFVGRIGSVAGPQYLWKMLRYDDEISSLYYQLTTKG